MILTKCLVCNEPTVLLEAVGCSAAYDGTCPHRADRPATASLTSTAAPGSTPGTGS